MKRTYKPSIIKAKRKHGFLERLKTKKGSQILQNRLKKRRKFLTH